MHACIHTYIHTSPQFVRVHIFSAETIWELRSHLRTSATEGHKAIGTWYGPMLQGLLILGTCPEGSRYPSTQVLDTRYHTYDGCGLIPLYLGTWTLCATSSLGMLEARLPLTNATMIFVGYSAKALDVETRGGQHTEWSWFLKVSVDDVTLCEEHVCSFCCSGTYSLKCRYGDMQHIVWFLAYGSSNLTQVLCMAVMKHPLPFRKERTPKPDPTQHP